jgi:HisJ family histidinol phosphate phosphatase
VSKTTPTASNKAKPSKKGKASPPPAPTKAPKKPLPSAKKTPVKAKAPAPSKAKTPAPSKAKTPAPSKAKTPAPSKTIAQKSPTKKAVTSAKPVTKNPPTPKKAAPAAAKKVAQQSAKTGKKAPPAKKATVAAPKKQAPPAAKAAPTAKKAPATKPSKASPPTQPAAATPNPVIVAAAEAPPEVTAPLRAKRNELPDFPTGPTANGAIYYDTHMHTPLCKHAWGEPEEYAAQAIKAGLKGIIFTCHCPMPDGFWPTVRMSDDEFDTYVALVDRAANAFKGQLDVRLGLESEFFPGVEPWIEKLHQRADFHYLLGAVHWQARDYLAKFETGTIEAFRKTYFNHLAASAESGLYDCLAHPDLVKNYHPDSWCLAIVKDSIASALDRIAKTGVAMELNTSGLNKSYSEMNPGLEMLKMMADREIPIVVASDAHRPHRVGEQFMTALSHLQEAGYDHVSYFLNRKRIDLKIAAVQASIKKAADSQLT